MARLSIQNAWWNEFKQTGNVDAFHNLHRYFYNDLVVFAFSYLKEKCNSEEVVDDVFICLWEKRATLGDIKNIKSFLYTCTRNKSLDLLRKSNKAPQFEDDLFLIERAAWTNDVVDGMERKEFLNLLQQEIDKLPKQCKLIFRMYINDGLKNAEIAEILGLAKKTVEAHIYIAFKKLTAILKNIYES